MLGTIDLTNPVSDDPLNTRLISWWLPLENNSGGRTFYNIRNNNNHGTLTNHPTDGSAWVPGPNGFVGLRFDGSNDYVSATVDLSPYNQLTLSFVLWVDTFGTGSQLALEYTTDGISNAGIHVNPNHVTGVFEVASGTGFGSVARFAQPSGAAWHHYTIVIDRTVENGIRAVYVDGKAVSLTYPFSGASAGNFANSTFYFMSRAGTSAFLAGRLSDVRINAGVLFSASAALALYKQFLTSYPKLLNRRRVRTKFVSGGTTYTRSYSDNLGLQDTFSRLASANRNYSDSTGLNNPFSRKSDANRIYSDNEGLNNPFSRQSTANRSYSDNEGLSDNYQRQSTANRNYSDNEGLTDTYSRTSDSNRNYTDNPALTDTYQRQSTGNRVYTDLLGLLDSFSRVSDGLRQYSDAISITDTFSRLSNSLRQYSDTSAISDTFSRQVNSLRAYSDTTGVSDNYQRISNALRNFTDLLGITDVVTLELIASGTYNLLVIDSLGISDNYSRTSNASRTLSDNLALNDQYQRIVQNFRTLSDTLGTSDQYQRLVNHLRSITDNLGVLDTADLDIAILIIVSAVIEFIIKFNYVQSTEFKLPAVQDFTEVRFSKK